MPKAPLPPHLIERDAVKQCSDCGEKFTADSKPSLSKAFAKHVREKHSRKREDFSQAAARIVKEATKDH